MCSRASKTRCAVLTHSRGGYCSVFQVSFTHTHSHPLAPLSLSLGLSCQPLPPPPQTSTLGGGCLLISADSQSTGLLHVNRRAEGQHRESRSCDAQLHEFGMVLAFIACSNFSLAPSRAPSHVPVIISFPITLFCLLSEGDYLVGRLRSCCLLLIHSFPCWTIMCASCFKSQILGSIRTATFLSPRFFISLLLLFLMV